MGRDLYRDQSSSLDDKLSDAAKLNYMTKIMARSLGGRCLSDHELRDLASPLPETTALSQLQEQEPSEIEPNLSGKTPQERVVPIEKLPNMATSKTCVGTQVNEYN